MVSQNTQENNCIDYIEFVVSDIERSKKFYGSVFGWTFTDYGPEYCEFNDARMKGGFTTQGVVTTGGPLIVLSHKNLEACLIKVREAGGIITQEIFTFPGGERFEFQDFDGYNLAVWRTT